MLKINLSRAVILLLTVCLSACIKKPDTIPVMIRVSEETLNFTKDGGSKTVTVEANCAWTITGGTSECSPSPVSGRANTQVTVTVKVQTNASALNRSYTLSVNAGGEVKNISVMQSSVIAPDLAALKIDFFGIYPAQNEKIYIPVEFITYDAGISLFDGHKEVKYYKTDLTALKAAFASNAAKVTAGSAEQVSGITVNDFSNELTYRFYAADNNYVEYKVRLTNPSDSYSGLPLLVLTTDDGADIKGKEEWQPGRFQFDPQGNAGVSAIKGVTGIKGRGNSTWGMPKKPYALKLNKKAEGTFGGMSPHKRWAVLANYADKTGLRNRVTFEIGKHTRLGWTPDSRFAEVILNGKFQGNYLITEQIKIDPNRVNIEEIDNTETDPDKITGGWLMEIDRFYSAGETRYFRPAISQLPVIVKAPEDANAAQMTYIREYFDKVEKLLYPDMPDGLPYHAGNAFLAGTPDSLQYHEYIDIASFIDYWIVQELAGNRDARLPGSVYMHKDVNGKLCAGPLWDFDQTTFLGDQLWLYYQYYPSETDYNEPLQIRALWYSQLFKDPKFKSRTKERWMELYSYLESGVPAFMDQEYARIAKSLDINWVDAGEDESQGIWTLTESEKENGGRNHDKNLSGADAVRKMKEKYLQRLHWLDRQIRAW